MTVSLLVLAAAEALLALVFRSVDLVCLVVGMITSSYRHQANPVPSPHQPGTRSGSGVIEGMFRKDAHQHMLALPGKSSGNRHRAAMPAPLPKLAVSSKMILCHARGILALGRWRN